MSDFVVRAQTSKKMLSDGMARKYGRMGSLAAMMMGPRVEKKKRVATGLPAFADEKSTSSR